MNTRILNLFILKVVIVIMLAIAMIIMVWSFNSIVYSKGLWV